MELNQIRQFSEIDGIRRNPGIDENGLFPKWNNSSLKFDYSLIGEGDIDETYLANFITSTINPTDDDYLVSVNQTQTGSTNSAYWASFTMAESATKYLKLGKLAWLDTFETPTLPGDQKVLFDQNNVIGGRTAFKYNYNTNKLLFQGTNLMFNTTGGTEGTYKDGVKYLGNYSFAFGNSFESTASGYYNISSGYKSGFSLGSTSERNVFYGPNAGEFASSTADSIIGIGPYAARYATDDGSFYLDNVDYGGSIAEKAGAFLYADLITERRLHIRNRLAVVREGMFGDSGLSDANGEGGMFQMVDGGGGVIKPQYHDGTVWQDFAAGQNHYLQEISEDSVTDGLWHFLVKDSTGTNTIQDLTLQLPILTDVVVPVAYTPSYPTITASDYGYIQISNTSTSTNKGFYYKAGFKWDNSKSELNIPGAIKLSSKAAYTTTNPIIRWDGALKHYYGAIDGDWVQLDNTPSTTTRDTALNLGEGVIKWFTTVDTDNNLLFRTFDTIPLGNTYNPHDRIHLTYTEDGYTALIGTTAERNRLSTTVDDATTDRMIDKANEGETLHIRALREGNNIVLTQTENYIRIDANTGGAATLMNGYNLGTYDWFAQRNGTNLEFFGMNTSDGRISISQANGTSTFDNVLSLNLNVDGANETVLTSKTYQANIFNTTVNGNGPTPTLYFRPLISDSISITTTANDEIVLETIAGGSSTNLGSGAKVYVDSSAPDFEFRTLVENNHITITEGINDITFDVDDITWTNLGTNTNRLIAQDGVDSFTFSQKGIVGTNGVTVTPSTNDITFTIPDIEKFELSTGEFVKSMSYSGTSNIYSTTPAGTLSFKLNHDDDINDGTPSYTARTIAEIKLGGGLKYDATNNILWNDTYLSGAVGDIDYHLNEIEDVSTTENYLFDFHVEDSLGNPTAESPLRLTIPKTSVPTATYTDNVSPHVGTVIINKSTQTHDSGSLDFLELDEATGELGISQTLVTYEVQNLLHDVNVSAGEITLRDQARANIGAAYVNGKTTEDFNTKDLNVSGTFTAAFASVKHTIGNIGITGSTIANKTSGGVVHLVSGNTGIDIISGSMNITLDTNVIGSLYIKDGSGTNMLKFDATTGNLYVKGKVIADDDIEAFSDNTTI